MYRKSNDSGQLCNKQNILTGKTTELGGNVVKDRARKYNTVSFSRPGQCYIGKEENKMIDVNLLSRKQIGRYLRQISICAEMIATET